MSTLKVTALLILLVGCHPKEVETEVVPGKASPFSTFEVVTTLNLLRSISDWPGDTTRFQTQFNLTAEKAQKLILPLHPIWDEKTEETAKNVPNWGEDEVKAVLDCKATCTCDFYQQVFDRNPEVLKEAAPELRTFTDSKVGANKESLLKCLDAFAVQTVKLLKHLEKEQPKFEAKSAY